MCPSTFSDTKATIIRSQISVFLIITCRIWEDFHLLAFVVLRSYEKVGCDDKKQGVTLTTSKSTEPVGHRKS